MMDKRKEFPESMITKALAKYLGTDKSSTLHAERMGWLFSLEAQTPSEERVPIRKLCSLHWEEAEDDGGPEKPLVSDKLSGISPEDFKLFRGLFADFGFWTRKQERQLILEAKGTPKPIGERDRVQARQYFGCLLKYPRRGALVYLVPEPASWLAWLNDRARDAGIGQSDEKTWGVVGWEPQVVPKIAGHLVHVVSEELAKTAELMDRASAFLIQNDL